MSLYVRLALHVLLVCMLMISPAPAIAGGGTSAAGFLWGFVSPGEDPAEMGKDGVDDVGPPRALREKWLRQNGVTFQSVAARWSDAEPSRLPDTARDSDFTWTAFDRSLGSIPAGRATHCLIKLDAGWANEIRSKDEQLYWRLAERFIEAAARRARKRGIRYYGVPGNEMSLTGRPDWAELYMTPVRHYAAAIHRASPDNQVIAGALVCGARDLIDELYKHGFKEHCDVLDIHAYAGSPGERRYHVGLSQVLEAHQALVDHGDGNKKIFLGEGWSVFPLPSHLDNLKQRPEYTAEDLDHYRKALVYGYAALTTPRPGYDPNWLLGARFFCLNDLWGAMGWKKRAVIERDKNGEPVAWNLDGYKLPYSPNAMDPQFRAWGLIDIDGKPKGEALEQFPPYVPRCSVKAEFEDDSAAVVYPGMPCRVRVSAINGESEPLANPRFSMDVFQGAGRRDIVFREVGASTASSISTGKGGSREFEMVAAPTLAGKDVLVQGGCEYEWQGRSYYADNWLRFRVASPGEFRLLPYQGLAVATDAPITLTFLLTDLTGRALPDTLDLKVKGEVILEQTSRETGPRSREYIVTARKTDTLAGGCFRIEASAGPAFAPIAADVAFPRPGRVPEQGPAQGRLINPGFEEFGPGSGFEGWDGPPSNIDDPAMADELPNHGVRMITKVYNETGYPAQNSQTVRAPEGFGSGKVKASAWTRGVAFAKATDHSAIRFRISLVFLDTNGRELRRDDSPYLMGTGKWEKLSFESCAAPVETASVRLILLHENTNPKGWHKAAVDNVRLEFD